MVYKGAAHFKEWNWLQDGTHLPAVDKVEVSPASPEDKLNQNAVGKIAPAVKFIATGRRSTPIQGNC